MKKFAFFLPVFFCLFQVAIGQAKGIPEDSPIGPCPVGQCSVGASIIFDQFNFHKPRTGCTSGFGLCIKIHVEPICSSCPMGYPTPGNMRTAVSGKSVTGWCVINGNKMELHLPSAIQQSDGYSRTDFSTFEVEDRSILIDA